MSIAGNIEDRLQRISKWAVPFVIFFPVGMFVVYMSYIMGMFDIVYTGIIDVTLLVFGIMFSLTSLVIIIMMTEFKEERVILSMILVFPLSCACGMVFKGLGFAWVP